jgi:hypothetical protein
MVALVKRFAGRSQAPVSFSPHFHRCKKNIGMPLDVVAKIKLPCAHRTAQRFSQASHFDPAGGRFLPAGGR